VLNVRPIWLIMALAGCLAATPVSAGETEPPQAGAVEPDWPPIDTLEGAVDYLISLWSESDRQQMTHTHYNNLAMYHFGLGTGLRNQYRLWNEESPMHQWFALRGIDHPDSMSGVIIYAAWLTLNDCEVDYEAHFGEEVQACIAFAREHNARYRPPSFPPPHTICPAESTAARTPRARSDPYFPIQGMDCQTPIDELLERMPHDPPH
jgi:hypothetical protein